MVLRLILMTTKKKDRTTRMHENCLRSFHLRNSAPASEPCRRQMHMKRNKNARRPLLHLKKLKREFSNSKYAVPSWLPCSWLIMVTWNLYTRQTTLRCVFECLTMSWPTKKLETYRAPSIRTIEGEGERVELDDDEEDEESNNGDDLESNSEASTGDLDAQERDYEDAADDDMPARATKKVKTASSSPSAQRNRASRRQQI
mmetsp:Transcript_2763/g.6469  ORF Transcript_2763/g.6469 Transcript_2763/m.6469 type:complete len:201 (-) Transcript_2763:139-741(-)